MPASVPKHVRWFCHVCQREWLYVYGAWDPDTQGCPVCHSMNIELKEYVPAFVGGDIPRDAVPHMTPPAPLAVTPEDNRTLAFLGV